MSLITNNCGDMTDDPTTPEEVREMGRKVALQMKKIS
jgi:hypothetical protein